MLLGWLKVVQCWYEAVSDARSRHIGKLFIRVHSRAWIACPAPKIGLVI